jgi:Protein of unknown function (DUF2934)
MKIIKDNKDHAHHHDTVSNLEMPRCKPQERINLIEKEAYLVASARGFGEGDALSDWLVAEKRIDNGWTVI